MHPEGDDAADVGATAAGTDDGELIVVHRPPVWAPLTLVAFVGLIVCTNVANVVWSTWADSHPAALLALSSRQRYLVLAVTGGISPLSYAIVGALRIALAFVVCHLIGRAYRDQALSWFTRYLGIRQRQLDTLREGFSKAEIGLIPFFAGSNIVAVLTGVHRTRPVKLAAAARDRHRRATGAVLVAGQDLRGPAPRRPLVHHPLPMVAAGPLDRHRRAGQPAQLPARRRVVAGAAKG